MEYREYMKMLLQNYILDMFEPIFNFLRYKFTVFGYRFSFWEILIGVEVFDICFTFIGKCLGKMEVE